MPHVLPLQTKNAPDGARETLQAIEDKFGQSLNIFSTLAHQPDVLVGVTKIDSGISEDLDPKLREIAYLHASRLNDCDYCGHYHHKKALGAGVSEAQVESLDGWRDSDAFDDHEKAVLDYAEQLTREADVDDEAVARVKGFLDDRQLVTLAATVALANFTNRVNHGLGIELP